jgi:hypothetical protein
MKKYLLFLLATLCFTMACNEKAKAQIQLFKSTSTAYATSSAQSSDTVTGTATTYFSNKAGTLNSSVVSKYVVYFQIDTTVYSSAPTINCYLQGSFDGTTWFNLNGAPLGTDGICADTLNSATFATAQQRMSAISGCVKYVNGATRGSAVTKVNYVRVVFSHSGSGTSTRIYNVYLQTSY